VACGRASPSGRWVWFRSAHQDAHSSRHGSRPLSPVVSCHANPDRENSMIVHIDHDREQLLPTAPLGARIWRAMSRALNPLGLRMPIQRRIHHPLFSRYRGRYSVTVLGRRRMIVRLSELAGQGQQVYFSPAYERGTTAALRTLLQPGDTFLDVGANIGWYTTLAALRVGPSGSVHAFEPHPVAFSDLVANVRVNRLTNVKALPIAIGSNSGHAMLVTEQGSPVSQSYISSNIGTNQQCHGVHVTTLDQLHNSLQVNHPLAAVVIKVDVEGLELDVLRGAARLIDAYKPIFVLEINAHAAATQHHSAEAAIIRLRNNGYNTFVTPDMRYGLPKLMLPLIELFAPGRAYVLRRVDEGDIRARGSRYLENVFCFDSSVHQRQLVQLSQKSIL
jgi:FkbM family methyltransferase